METIDDEHLRLLSTFHKVAAGAYCLFGFCGMPHFFFGLTFMMSPQTFEGAKGGPPPPWFGLIFALVGAAVICYFWVMAVMNFLASQRLTERKGRTFLFVVSGINCFWMPIGTALGVFTIIVLSRESVRTMFLDGTSNPVKDVV